MEIESRKKRAGKGIRLQVRVLQLCGYECFHLSKGAGTVIKLSPHKGGHGLALSTLKALIPSPRIIHCHRTTHNKRLRAHISFGDLDIVIVDLITNTKARNSVISP